MPARIFFLSLAGNVACVEGTGGRVGRGLWEDRRKAPREEREAGDESRLAQEDGLSLVVGGQHRQWQDPVSKCRK